jgi:hypothetical protein
MENKFGAYYGESARTSNINSSLNEFTNALNGTGLTANITGNTVTNYNEIMTELRSRLSAKTDSAMNVDGIGNATNKDRVRELNGYLLNEPPRRRAAGYRRFLREIFVYAGEHIPRTPVGSAPRGGVLNPKRATPFNQIGEDIMQFDALVDDYRDINPNVDTKFYDWDSMSQAEPQKASMWHAG